MRGGNLGYRCPRVLTTTSIEFIFDDLFQQTTPGPLAYMHCLVLF